MAGDRRFLLGKWAADSLQHKATSFRQVKQTRLMRLLSTHNNLLHWGFANALMDVENPTPHFFHTPSTHFQILLWHSKRHVRPIALKLSRPLSPSIKSSHFSITSPSYDYINKYWKKLFPPILRKEKNRREPSVLGDFVLNLEDLFVCIHLQ